MKLDGNWLLVHLSDLIHSKGLPRLLMLMNVPVAFRNLPIHGHAFGFKCQLKFHGLNSLKVRNNLLVGAP